MFLVLTLGTVNFSFICLTLQNEVPIIFRVQLITNFKHFKQLLNLGLCILSDDRIIIIIRRPGKKKIVMQLKSNEVISVKNKVLQSIPSELRSLYVDNLP